MAKDNIQQVEITQLSDRDHVRLRKGMYLPNINYMVYEAVDNSVDEFIAGHGDTIYVKIDQEKIIYVQDIGRGLPISPSKEDPTVSQAELALGSTKAGGKFGASGEGSYDVKTGGLNGVGVSACNYLSEWLQARIYKNGKIYGLDFTKGEVTNKLYEVGPIGEDDPETGTLVMLQPDVEIWKDDDDFDLPAINNRMRKLTYLNPGLTIIVDIDYDGTVIQETYCHPEGLVAYVNEVAGKKELATPIWQTTETFEDIDVTVALTYSDGYAENVYAYTNNVLNNLGGSHLTGLKEGINNAIKNYYNDTASNKNKVVFTSDDTREGIITILSVKVKDPNFEGQGKAKLNMPKVRTAVRKVTEEFVADMMDKNPDVAKIIIAKTLDAARAREAAKRARDTSRKAKSIDAGTPDKLADCSNKNPEETEIFLVEGDSAAGSCKNGRDNKIQAVLPVFGKINNVEKARLEDVIKSVKMLDVFKALKCGIDEEFDIEKLRYHKIIIMADADVDGSHIQTLWITFFYRFMRPIIENGHLYLACPPLFQIKKGKDVRYAYSDAEKDTMLAEMGQGSSVSRYKGLGEMDAPTLWETTLDPARRKLIQIVIDNIEEDESMISTCMGEDVAPRREFIMENALLVKEI
jgi:DNA gyrase subunit B